MNVSLTNELENYVNHKVKSGLYTSASEVIREGLRLLKQQEVFRKSKLEQLRKDIAIGIEQADRGESRPFDLKEILTEGRRRLARERKKKS